MVGVVFVYVNTVYGFLWVFFLCLVGCFSMVIWTPTVLSVLHACVLYFCVCTCSAQLNMFHMERRSRNALIMMMMMMMMMIIMITILYSTNVTRFVKMKARGSSLGYAMTTVTTRMDSSLMSTPYIQPLEYGASIGYIGDR